MFASSVLSFYEKRTTSKRIVLKLFFYEFMFRETQTGWTQKISPIQFYCSFCKEKKTVSKRVILHNSCSRNSMSLETHTGWTQQKSPYQFCCHFILPKKKNAFKRIILKNLSLNIGWTKKILFIFIIIL